MEMTSVIWTHESKKKKKKTGEMKSLSLLMSNHRVLPVRFHDGTEEEYPQGIPGVS